MIRVSRMIVMVSVNRISFLSRSALPAAIIAEPKLSIRDHGLAIVCNLTDASLQFFQKIGIPCSFI